MPRMREAGSTSVGAFRAAFLLSALGYEFLFFVMTLRIYDITGTAINVGVFTALTFFPKLLSPLYGALVDRLGARSLLALAAAAAAAIASCLAFAGSLTLLYALWFLLSALFMLIGNARAVLITETSGDPARTTVSLCRRSRSAASRAAWPDLSSSSAGGRGA